MNKLQKRFSKREQFSGATPADLYDPNAMPKPLLDAHRANYEAVDAVYGTRRFKADLEHLEFSTRHYTDPHRRKRNPPRQTPLSADILRPLILDKNRALNFVTITSRGKEKAEHRAPLG